MGDIAKHYDLKNSYSISDTKFNFHSNFTNLPYLAHNLRPKLKLFLLRSDTLEYNAYITKGYGAWLSIKNYLRAV